MVKDRQPDFKLLMKEIAIFKKNLRRPQPKNHGKLRTAAAQLQFTVSYKKNKVVSESDLGSISFVYNLEIKEIL